MQSDAALFLPGSDFPHFLEIETLPLPATDRSLNLNGSDGSRDSAQHGVSGGLLDVLESECGFPRREGNQSESTQSLRAIAAVVEEVTF